MFGCSCFVHNAVATCHCGAAGGSRARDRLSFCFDVLTVDMLLSGALSLAVLLFQQGGSLPVLPSLYGAVPLLVRMRRGEVQQSRAARDDSRACVIMCGLVDTIIDVNSSDNASHSEPSPIHDASSRTTSEMHGLTVRGCNWCLASEIHTAGSDQTRICQPRTPPTGFLLYRQGLGHFLVDFLWGDFSDSFQSVIAATNPTRLVPFWQGVDVLTL